MGRTNRGEVVKQHLPNFVGYDSAAKMSDPQLTRLGDFISGAGSAVLLVAIASPRCWILHRIKLNIHVNLLPDSETIVDRSA